jgi:hypothetical protein
MPELATKAYVLAIRSDLPPMEQELRVSFRTLETEFRARLEIQTLRLTIRLGIMLAVGVAVLAVISRRA